MISSSEQFTTLTAIALAYDNSHDTTLLPDAPTLISIIKDPNSSLDSTQVALHILSIIQPPLTATEEQQIRYAVLRLSKVAAINPARLNKINASADKLLGTAKNN